MGSHVISSKNVIDNVYYIFNMYKLVTTGMETEKEKKEWSRVKLTTATAIRNAKYKEEYGPQKVFGCGGGLCLVLKPSSKSWLFRYYLHGKQKSMSFGDYDLVDYATAMELRKEAKKKILNGESPLQKKELTFEDFFNDWYLAKNQDLTKDVKLKVEQAFKKHVLPFFGHIPLKSIKADFVVEWLLEREKQQLKDGYGTYQIIKVHKRLISVFEFAVGVSKLDAVPTVKAAVKSIKKHRAKNYRCMDFERLPKFFQALHDYRSAKITKLMIHFLILSCMRSDEIRNFEWSWVHWDENYIIVPEHKTSTKIVNAGGDPVPWYVFLTPQSKRILETAKEITGEYQYVFPCPYNFKKIASTGIFRDALERLGFHDEHTPHGFRSVYKTKMFNLNPHDEIYLELNLAHSIDLNKSGINYTSDLNLMFHPERAKLMQVWANIIDEQKANVV